jgi:hypothetical protein
VPQREDCVPPRLGVGVLERPQEEREGSLGRRQLADGAHDAPAKGRPRRRKARLEDGKGSSSDPAERAVDVLLELVLREEVHERFHITHARREPGVADAIG